MACDEMDKIGPYELNSIVTGECSELMERLPDGCIDLVLTSPPYDSLRTYHGFVFPFERIAQQLYRVTKPGGVVVWVVGDATEDGTESGSSFRQALYFMGMGFNLHDTMIFAKNNYTPLTHNRYEQQFEYCFILTRGRLTTFNPLTKRNSQAGRLQGNTFRHNGNDLTKRHKDIGTKETSIRPNIWFYDVGMSSTSKDKAVFNHPAAFPEALARDHILSWSNPGELVLDPMVGSGTVAKMAVVTGRQYLGFDISPEYCDLARRRVGEVEREQRREWKQIRDNGKLDDLPMFQLYQE